MGDEQNLILERRRNDDALHGWRLRELERRVGRIEAFLLGALMAVALSVASALLAGLGLPLVA